MTAGALATLVRSAPVLTALAVDFRRNQWTFTLPPQPVGPGDYLVLRAGEAHQALDEQHHAPQAIVLEAPSSRVHARFRTGCAGDQCLEVESEDGELDISLWRDHVPDAGREQYWPGPAFWRGSERRRAADGSTWSRQLRMVCDDFGMLVEVRS